MGLRSAITWTYFTIVIDMTLTDGGSAEASIFVLLSERSFSEALGKLFMHAHGRKNFGKMIVENSRHD